MSEGDTSLLCRLCQKCDMFYVDIFDSNRKDGILLCDVIQELLLIPVSQEDGLPSSVCQKCMLKLIEFNDFKVMCIKSLIDLYNLRKHGEETPHLESSAVRRNGSLSFSPALNPEHYGLSYENVMDQSDGYSPEANPPEHSLLEASVPNCSDVGPAYPETEPRYVCTVCSKSFRSSGGLGSHMNVHWTSHTCSTCALNFSSYTDYLQHRKTHIKKNCKLCGKRFQNAVELEKHVVEHKIEGLRDGGHVCLECGKTFMLKELLSHHIKRHIIGKNHVCKICNIKFTTRKDLVAHESCHAKDVPFEVVS
ncbi:zinc finger protein 672-like [Hetaerina americana]|uniref:zinc finger protein 672-like n=1 Tax=Hetaerina americana TaxID=62018 RepID=UPI003A7F3774